MYILLNILTLSTKKNGNFQKNWKNPEKTGKTGKKLQKTRKN
jgi:hypothetical protein